MYIIINQRECKKTTTNYYAHALLPWILILLIWDRVSRSPGYSYSQQGFSYRFNSNNTVDESLKGSSRPLNLPQFDNGFHSQCKSKNDFSLLCKGPKSVIAKTIYVSALGGGQEAKIENICAEYWLLGDMGHNEMGERGPQEAHCWKT